jgi:hypothetical protein
MKNKIKTGLKYTVLSPLIIIDLVLNALTCALFLILIKIDGILEDHL